MSIEITREGERLVIALPYAADRPNADPSVACGTKAGKVRCTEGGALDLCRAIASALGREDIVNLCFEEAANGVTPTS